MPQAEPSIAELNDLTPVKPGVKKEPQFAIDTSGSMSWPAAEGRTTTRWEVITEALGGLVARLEGHDSQAAAEAAAGKDAGGVMTVTFASSVIDLEDLSTANWRKKLSRVQVGGGTVLTPALRKLTDLYMEEFGDTPDIDRPLQLTVVLTDGEASDLDDVVAWLSKLSSRTFVVFAVLGFGPDHDHALAAYRQVEANNKQMRVVTVGGSTNPDEIANALLSLIGE